ADPAFGDQLLHDVKGGVDGNGYTDALRRGVHCRVDADHFAPDVDERPARVAGVDGRVGLHQVGVGLPAALVGVVDLDLPPLGGEHAHGDGVLVLLAVGVADGDHPLAGARKSVV